MISEIDRKYMELQGAGVVLGAPLVAEADTAGGRGRYRHYQDGSIYWTPETGACEVHGAIRGRWAALELEAGRLGYPTSDEQAAADGDGRFNTFEGGCIYWTRVTGAHAVIGPIHDLWQELGAEKSSLGYPKEEEKEAKFFRGRFSEFEHGSIYWDEERGAYEVFPVLLEGQEPDEVVYGRWSKEGYDTGVVGIHAALLHTGKVLLFSYGNPDMPSRTRLQNYPGSAVLDPSSSGGVELVPLAGRDVNLFCSGHAFLPDGRLLVCGSEKIKDGMRAVYTFTPRQEGGGVWEHAHDLPEARWYPGCAPLHDGSVFIIGGQIFDEDRNAPNETYGIFDPARGLQPPQPAPIFESDGDPALHPFVVSLPSGEVLIHAGTRTRFFNPAGRAFDGRVLEAAERPDRNSRTYDVQGTCVLLPLLPDTTPPYRARVLLIGGGGRPEVTARTWATNTCEILDLSEPSPSWRLAAPMSNPRVMPDAVLLPDGRVLVTNGSYTGMAEAGANPVMQSELYDPEAGAWTTLAPMAIPRLYHSTALLLPDGRVMTAGPDSVWHPALFQEAKLDIEFYQPPYLFAGPRPIILTAPPLIRYNEEFEVRAPNADNVSAAALLRPGAVTHSFNSSQRYVGLSVTGSNRTRLELLAPPDRNVAPPGRYMLFLIGSNKVPSTARFITLE